MDVSSQKKIERFCILVLLACAGYMMVTWKIIGGIGVASLLECISWLLELEKPIEITPLRALLLGLPVFIGLWLFRTHDTHKQIEKSEEQIQKSQENTNTSILSNGYTLLVSSELPSRCLGVKSLAELKRKYPVFAGQIDQATIALNLSNKTEESSSGKGQGEDIEVANLTHARYTAPVFNQLSEEGVFAG